MERIQHRYIRATAFAGVLLLSCVLGACGGGPRESTRYPAGSIAAIMAADERLDTLMRITEHDMPPVALDSITSLDLDITILAPTDDAFAALPPGTLEVLLDDDNVRGLQLVFDHHVIGRGYSLGELRAKAQSADGEVEALAGGAIQLTLVDGVLKVDEATVIAGDIDAENGVIHVIDAVMIPDSLVIP